jgi:DMSO/TMAO reductase YedYZ molybdopterin-dependent catalytic subunit
VSRASEGTDAPAWRPTPLAALELPEVPTGEHFVRDHFPVPALDPDTWLLEIHGDAERLVVDLERLRAMPARTLRTVLECAGHRRVEFDPVPHGVPWACGAVAEGRFTGASLRALLHAAGIPPGTLEVVLEGADAGEVEGFSGTHRFARSLPLEKALDRDVVLAYEMGGEPIAVERGGPVRAIVPGWYATDSVKWLTRVWFTPEEFDGVFQAHDYRLIAPGEPGPGSRMTELPVHALITTPADGERLSRRGLRVRGVAWGGAGGVEQVLVRVDEGPWEPAVLDPRRGAYARVAWTLEATLDQGLHEIACRAIDREGGAQPDRPPVNVRGYGNNAVHRVRVAVGTLSPPAS